MTRARIAAAANPTYRLDPVDRDVVGVLQCMRLWSNRTIGAAYGIDAACVSRHGKRLAARGVL